jgi:hypothetical protein
MTASGFIYHNVNSMAKLDTVNGANKMKHCAQFLILFLPCVNCHKVVNGLSFLFERGD